MNIWHYKIKRIRSHFQKFRKNCYFPDPLNSYIWTEKFKIINKNKENNIKLILCFIKNPIVYF